MKKTATLLFMGICACASAAHAKTTKSTTNTPFPHFSNQEPSSGGITINTRVVKKVRSSFSGPGSVATVSSEVLYEYNSDRGSNVDIYDITDDDVQYDVSYTNSVVQGGAIQRKLKRQQHYNNNDKVDVLTYSGWKSSSNSYSDSLFYTYTYNAQFKNIIDAAYLTVLVGNIGNQVSYLNTINPQGNVIEMFCWGTNYHLIFQYDNTGRLLTQYDYTTAVNNVINYNEKDSFVYNASGKVSEYYIFNWGATSWKIAQQWLYTYSPTGDVVSIDKKKWSGASFINNLFESFNYINSDLVADATDKWNSTTNGYDHATKMTWTYNSNHQPTQLNTYTWINNSWATTNTDYQVVWQYQTYFPTAIYDASLQVNTNLYPVPAQSSINLALSWKTLQPFNISIADMTGKTLMQWDEDAVSEYHKNIPVDNMPSGNYFVVLTGKDGLRSTQKFQVSH